MSAQDKRGLYWLLDLACLDSQLQANLEPWRARLSGKAHLGAKYDEVSDEALELGVWMAGLVGFPAGMMAEVAAAGAKQGQISDWRSQAERALARDPEPPIDWVGRALRHALVWLESGVTPFAGYYSLRRLHFLTRGRSSRLIRLVHRALDPAGDADLKPDHLLGLDQAAADGSLATLAENSVVILPQLLPQALIGEIKDFAASTPCFPSLADREHRDPITGEYALPLVMFDPGAPLAHRYDFHFATLWECGAIQRIAADPLWPWLAERYLGARTRLAASYLWWSTAFEGPQSRYTGQVYHVDIDRFGFLNFFFYLSDVGPDNGPQVYARGSHHDLDLALAIDQRWSDEAILAHYGAQHLLEVHGPAGTVILGDTLAHHKGKTLKQGTRLMFQMEFAISTLGENTPNVPRPSHLEPALRDAIQAEPWRYPKLAGWV